MERTIPTKEQVLEAAEQCPQTREALEILFPNDFAEKELDCQELTTGEILLLEDTTPVIVFAGSPVKNNSCLIYLNHGGWDYVTTRKKDAKRAGNGVIKLRVYQGRVSSVEWRETI